MFVNAFTSDVAGWQLGGDSIPKGSALEQVFLPLQGRVAEAMNAQEPEGKEKSDKKAKSGDKKKGKK